MDRRLLPIGVLDMPEVIRSTSSSWAQAHLSYGLSSTKTRPSWN